MERLFRTTMAGLDTGLRVGQIATLTHLVCSADQDAIMVCNAMMTEKAEFLPLKQFFSTYFNEDWDYDAEDSDGILKKFALETTVEERRALASMIEKYVAAFKSDVEFGNSLFKELGSYYRPAADGLSSRAWLERIVELLRRL
jgi:hypothetical protein